MRWRCVVADPRPFVPTYGAPPPVEECPNLRLLANYAIPAGRALMLRACGPNGEAAHNGFVWPSVPGSVVVCPDWRPEPVCGGGLHGWLHGEGDVGASDFASRIDSLWLVVEVDAATVVEFERKCKVPGGMVVASGKRAEVCGWLAGVLPCRSIVYGTATAGDGGTATAGYGGTATAGDGGTATAGDGGSIAVRWWDGQKGRYRLISADVGENGIEANKPYHVVDGKLVAGKAL